MKTMAEPLHLEVTEDAPITPGVCPCCKQPVGSHHSLDCVCVKKVVRLDITFTIEVERPYSWDNEAIEFEANESSSCAGNLLDEVNSYAERLEQQGWCMCSATTAKVSERQPVEMDVSRAPAYLKSIGQAGTPLRIEEVE